MKWLVVDTMYSPLSEELLSEGDAYLWLSKHKNKLQSNGVRRFHVKPIDTVNTANETKEIPASKHRALLAWMRNKHSSLHLPRAVTVTFLGVRYSAVAYVRKMDTPMQFFYILGDAFERWRDNHEMVFHVNGGWAPEFTIIGNMPDAFIGPDDIKTAPFGGYFVLGEWDARKSGQIPVDKAYRLTRYNVWVNDVKL